jgi:hypothetical protein
MAYDTVQKDCPIGVRLLPPVKRHNAQEHVDPSIHGTAPMCERIK